MSFFEVDAFASWRCRRLPNEAEWELAANGSSIHKDLLDTGKNYPTRTERDILASYAEAIIAATDSDYPRPLRLLELGAGTAAKTGIAKSRSALAKRRNLFSG